MLAESFFNQCNRIPPMGRFDADFDQHLSTLISTIRAAIQRHEKVSTSPGSPSIAEHVTRMCSATQSAAKSSELMRQLAELLADPNITDDELIAVSGDLRYLTRKSENIIQAHAMNLAANVLFPLLDRCSNEVASQVLEVIQNLSGPSDNSSISGLLRYTI